MNEEIHQLRAVAIRQKADQLPAFNVRGFFRLLADCVRSLPNLLGKFILRHPIDLVALAFSIENTITLSILGMNCPSRPCMIEQSISYVDGVQSGHTELETRNCRMKFYVAAAMVESTLCATAGIGYPSTIIQQSGASNG